jgi:hypothetical protein
MKFPKIINNDMMTVAGLILRGTIKGTVEVKDACYHSVQNLLYGCETWSLILREERRLRVFDNRVLRGIFGPKRDEVTEEWRKLHNEELNDQHSLPNIVWVIKSRRMRWAGHIARMGEGRGMYRVLVGKTEGKSPMGRPRRRW